MEILAATLGAEAAYTTISTAGVVNLAPFSAFPRVSTKPPMVGVNIGRKSGERRDTSDTAKLRPVCRLGGTNYARLGEIVTMRAIAQTPKTVFAR